MFCTKLVEGKRETIKIETLVIEKIKIFVLHKYRCRINGRH